MSDIERSKRGGSSTYPERRILSKVRGCLVWSNEGTGSSKSHQDVATILVEERHTSTTAIEHADLSTMAKRPTACVQRLVMTKCEHRMSLPSSAPPEAASREARIRAITTLPAHLNILDLYRNKCY